MCRNAAGWVAAARLELLRICLARFPGKLSRRPFQFAKVELPAAWGPLVGTRDPHLAFFLPPEDTT